MKLSILIPSIPSRVSKLNVLRDKLLKQIQYCREVHLTLGMACLIVDDSKPYLEGGPSIGKKRQNLVNAAESEYLCFLDDDDDISPSYVETLLRLCNQGKDVCTFRNISKLDGYWCVIQMGLDNPNEQAHDGGIVLRKPWHICPVKTVYAKMATFPDSNYGEDWQWFEQILPMLETEAFSPALLHQYNHSEISEADKAHEKSRS